MSVDTITFRFSPATSRFKVGQTILANLNKGKSNLADPLQGEILHVFRDDSLLVSPTNPQSKPIFVTTDKVLSIIKD